MHPNPAFRQTGPARNIAFARAQGFGTLAMNGDPAPVLAHVPFLLDEAGTTAQLHLLRSNPIAQLGAGPAVISVIGPQGYISPDWYGVEDQVPTWNYIAVHLRGHLVPLASEALPDILARLSEHFEARLAPKPVWTMDKMTDGVAARMMRQILPFRFDVEEVQGTWKLGQNKPEAARLSAADHVADADLADLMRSFPTE